MSDARWRHLEPDWAWMECEENRNRSHVNPALIADNPEPVGRILGPDGSTIRVVHYRNRVRFGFC